MINSNGEIVEQLSFFMTMLNITIYLNKLGEKDISFEKEKENIIVKELCKYLVINRYSLRIPESTKIPSQYVIDYQSLITRVQNYLITILKVSSEFENSKFYLNSCLDFVFYVNNNFLDAENGMRDISSSYNKNLFYLDVTPQVTLTLNPIIN